MVKVKVKQVILLMNKKSRKMENKAKKPENQNEFYRAVISYRSKPTEVLETHTLRLDKVDYPFYLANKTRDSALVFMEKGLFTLYPSHPNGMDRPPKGYPWTMIYKTDTPEIIQAKLYDHRKRFGPAMRKKLKKLMAW